jgi:beta-lactamase superfamily II metal-dependent hydrolase
MAVKAPKKKTIAVRMYNVGFGDAFLVEFPTGEGVRRVLFDCGTIGAPPSHSLGDVVGQVIDRCTTAEEARIDVVVATHRHRDHVHGFADARWSDVEVGEVWMPWTEHPRDPEAAEIRRVQSSLAAALQRAFGARAGLDARSEEMGLLALNSLTNEAAMNTLHRGFSGRPKREFLSSPDEGVRSFTTDALPGVTVHVLGPSRDRDIIRDMNPPKGKSYLTQASGPDEVREVNEPFGDEWALEEAQFLAGGWRYGTVSPDDVALIRAQNESTDLAVMVALDAAVNGTSLVIALEFGDACLLFAGDAQWGTWNRILRDPVAADVVKRATFFKVGHHGSHNATPKEFVENLLPGNCCTMVSTRKLGSWDIPRPPLVAALKGRTSLFAESDKPEEAPAAFKVYQKMVIEAKVPF